MIILGNIGIRNFLMFIFMKIINIIKFWFFFKIRWLCFGICDKRIRVVFRNIEFIFFVYILWFGRRGFLDVFLKCIELFVYCV